MAEDGTQASWLPRWVETSVVEAFLTDFVKEELGVFFLFICILLALYLIPWRVTTVVAEPRQPIIYNNQEISFCIRHNQMHRILASSLFCLSI